MTNTSFRRRLVVISAAVVLGGTSLGCGVIDTVTSMADAANVLSDFSDRLGKADQLTYTAEYKVLGDESDVVTRVQQPPRSAIINGDKRMIFTDEYMINCAGGECQQAPFGAVAAGGAEDAYLVAGVAGPGFVTPEMAVGLIAAAALAPGAEVKSSKKKIAGQESLCAKVTGIKSADDESVQDFSVCVTEAGVLASFDGTLSTGSSSGVELISYSTKVDESAFAPPAGATVVDVTASDQ
ncbi:MAG TPA: hypothetical protein VFX61_07615 [Micromonosporaceae bacterium]|nr:hypothetical protein [Micromonosporaceae bacterium]